MQNASKSFLIVKIYKTGDKLQWFCGRLADNKAENVALAAGSRSRVDQAIKQERFSSSEKERGRSTKSGVRCNRRSQAQNKIYTQQQYTAGQSQCQWKRLVPCAGGT